MIQIDVALSASVGATFAWAARHRIRAESGAHARRWLAWALVFQAAVLIPGVIYFLVGWPAWDTMYWFDRETLPAWLVPVTAAVCLGAGALGYLLAEAAVRRGKDLGALGIAAAFNVPALLVMGIWHDRFLHVGTRETFASGAPVNLVSSDLMVALVVVIGGVIGVPMAVVLWRWNAATATPPRS